MLSSVAGYIIPAIVLLGALIFFHELGHFMFAKLLGVKVERFSIGLGPALIKRTMGETEYMLAAIPFGGYVKMLGENTSLEDVGQEDVAPPSEKDLERAFDRQPVWKRAAIILMGPVFNIVLAFLIYFGLFYFSGTSHLLPEVGSVVANSPAYEAGLEKGDMITAIGGETVETWSDLTALIQKSEGGPLSVEVTRGETSVELTISPRVIEDKNEYGVMRARLVIGINASGNYRQEEVGLMRGAYLGAEQTVKVGKTILDVVVMMVKRVLPAKTLGGPIYIFKAAGDFARMGVVQYLALMAAISVNLGVLNLLPVPVLDGGHLVFLSIEAVRRKPLGEKAIIMSQKVGMALLLCLMIFATYNDIVRVITGDWGP